MLSKDEIEGLNMALNEATLLGLELSPDMLSAAITIALICLNPDGSIPDDRRIQILLQPLGAVFASLTDQIDGVKKTIPFAPDKILEIVQSFKGQPIYGWKFIDCGDEDFLTWKDKLSMFHQADGNEGKAHSLDVFQDNLHRNLRVRLYFDEIYFNTPDHEQVFAKDVIALGKRGWDAILLDHNKQVQDAYGIHPMKPTKILNN